MPFVRMLAHGGSVPALFLGRHLGVAVAPRAQL